MSNLLKERMKMQLARVGLTQIEAARLAKVSRDYIHKATQRGSVPNDKAVRNRISKVLKCDDSWLWWGFEDDSPSGKRKFKISKDALASGKTKITIELDSELAEKVVNILKA